MTLDQLDDAREADEIAGACELEMRTQAEDWMCSHGNPSILGRLDQQGLLTAILLGILKGGRPVLVRWSKDELARHRFRKRIAPLLRASISETAAVIWREITARLTIVASYVLPYQNKPSSNLVIQRGAECYQNAEERYQGALMRAIKDHAFVTVTTLIDELIWGQPATKESRRDFEKAKKTREALAILGLIPAEVLNMSAPAAQLEAPEEAAEVRTELRQEVLARMDDETKRAFDDEMARALQDSRSFDDKMAHDSEFAREMEDIKVEREMASARFGELAWEMEERLAMSQWTAAAVKSAPVGLQTETSQPLSANSLDESARGPVVPVSTTSDFLLTDARVALRRRLTELREMMARWRKESRNPVYALVLSCSQQQMLYLGVLEAVADLGEALLMACARSHEHADSEFLEEVNRLAGDILPKMAAKLWRDLTANVRLVKCPPNLVLDYLEVDGHRIVLDYWEVTASRVRSLACERLAPIADQTILDRQKGTITFDLPPGIPRDFFEGMERVAEDLAIFLPGEEAVEAEQFPETMPAPVGSDASDEALPGTTPAATGAGGSRQIQQTAHWYTGADQSQAGESAQMHRAQEAQRLKESHKRKKPVRRNERYEGIDKALREFAAARPKSHEEVFRLLDDRKVALPNRRLFKSPGGWLKGFQQNRHTASAWLSQAWGRLSLPAFPRGPKK